MKPQKKILFFIIAAILPVLILHCISKRNAEKKNGFMRVFSNVTVKEEANLNINYDSFYISGFDSERFYLGNYTASLLLLNCDYHLKDTIHQIMPISLFKNVDRGNLHSQINPPNLYLTETNTPTLIMARTPYGQERKVFLGDLRFDIFHYLSPSSFIIRYFDFNLSQLVLQKISIQSTIIRGKKYIPTKQIDGNFSVDGNLTYNKLNHQFIYSYYYRNEFICLDTNLNELFIGHTIDTTTIARLTIKKLNSKGSTETMLAAPPLYVSKRCITNGKWIYINSALVSDTENRAEFKRYSVIDIYNSTTGSYHGSIKLPDHQGNKLRDFAVSDNKLIAIFGEYLVVYTINVP